MLKDLQRADLFYGSNALIKCTEFYSGEDNRCVLFELNELQ